jgi:excisionase family DNA binding protein
MATKWLTVGQAARRIGVSESTVWRLLRGGTLASSKLRGRRMIAATSLHALAREAARPGVELRPLTLDDPLFRLSGKFRSSGRGPGSSDKHRHLGARS